MSSPCLPYDESVLNPVHSASGVSKEAHLPSPQNLTALQIIAEGERGLLGNWLKRDGVIERGQRVKLLEIFSIRPDLVPIDVVLYHFQVERPMWGTLESSCANMLEFVEAIAGIWPHRIEAGSSRPALSDLIHSIITDSSRCEVLRPAVLRSRNGVEPTVTMLFLAKEMRELRELFGVNFFPLPRSITPDLVRVAKFVGKLDVLCCRYAAAKQFVGINELQTCMMPLNLSLPRSLVPRWGMWTILSAVNLASVVADIWLNVELWMSYRAERTFETLVLFRTSAGFLFSTATVNLIFTVAFLHFLHKVAKENSISGYINRILWTEDRWATILTLISTIASPEAGSMLLGPVTPLAASNLLKVVLLIFFPNTVRIPTLVLSILSSIIVLGLRGGRALVVAAQGANFVVFCAALSVIVFEHESSSFLFPVAIVIVSLSMVFGTLRLWRTVRGLFHDERNGLQVDLFPELAGATAFLACVGDDAISFAAFAYLTSEPSYFHQDDVFDAIGSGHASIVCTIAINVAFAISIIVAFPHIGAYVVSACLIIGVSCCVGVVNFLWFVGEALAQGS